MKEDTSTATFQDCMKALEGTEWLAAARNRGIDDAHLERMLIQHSRSSLIWVQGQVQQMLAKLDMPAAPEEVLNKDLEALLISQIVHSCLLMAYWKVDGGMDWNMSTGFYMGVAGRSILDIFTEAVRNSLMTRLLKKSGLAEMLGELGVDPEAVEAARSLEEAQSAEALAAEQVRIRELGDKVSAGTASVSEMAMYLSTKNAASGPGVH